MTVSPATQGASAQSSGRGGGLAHDRGATVTEGTKGHDPEFRLAAPEFYDTQFSEEERHHS